MMNYLKKIKEFSFAIGSKTLNKGINLIKEVKGLYTESCKTLKKEIEYDTKAMIAYANGLEEIITKMSILPKDIYNSLQSLSKFQCHSSQK
jgi:hypothetical protein